MRVIGGSLKGKRLRSFRGQKIRPTSDRVKESLFNIIGDQVLEGAEVLDLFAGTGNLGIEALSRGAGKVCFVERDRDSIKVLRENLMSCGLTEKCEVIPVDVKKAIPGLEKRSKTFDIIFLDPPYGRGLAGEVLEVLGRSTIFNDVLVVAEHAPGDDIEDSYENLVLRDRRRYGDTSLSFFEGKVD